MTFEEYMNTSDIFQIFINVPLQFFYDKYKAAYNLNKNTFNLTKLISKIKF